MNTRVYIYIQYAYVQAGKRTGGGRTVIRNVEHANIIVVVVVVVSRLWRTWLLYYTRVRIHRSCRGRVWWASTSNYRHLKKSE